MKKNKTDRTDKTDGIPARQQAAVEFPRGVADFPVARRWEYMRIRERALDDIEIDAAMDRMGMDGWECYAVAPYGTVVHFYFKRERME